MKNHTATEFYLHKESSLARAGLRGRSLWRYLRQGAPALLLAIGICHPFQANAQAPALAAPTPLADGNALLTITGAPQAYLRLDGSTNLEDWSPLALVFNSNGVAQVADMNATNYSSQFYRAVQVPEGADIEGLSTFTGAPGSQLTIYGQFFAEGKPGDNVVTIGGVPAVVLSASNVRLVVQVPTDVVSGSVSVTTPSGRTMAVGYFKVVMPLSADNAAHFIVPEGMNANDFIVVNTYNKAQITQQSSARSFDFTIPLRSDLPLLTMAAPRDPNRGTFFYALTLSTNSFTIDSGSTAAAMVFMSPYLMTSDPNDARSLLGLIVQDTNVLAFAQAIASIYQVNNSPFTDTNFALAYSNAVVSVAAKATAQLPASKSKLGATPAPLVAASSQSLDLEYLETILEGTNLAVKGMPFNPVDWVARVQEIDVAKAFPRGPSDFTHVLKAHGLKSDGTVINFPLVPNGFTDERLVSADLFFSRFDVVKSVAKALVSLAGDPSTPMTLPNRDAVYVVRGIGPALTPWSEFTYAHDNLTMDHYQALAINLVNLTMDSISLVIEVGNIKEGFGTKLLREALKIAPTLDSVENVEKGLQNLSAFVIKEGANKAVEFEANAAQARAELGLEAASTFAVPLKVWLKVFKKIGYAGQVAERLSGLARTSPLESAFVVVGEPFRLEVVSVSPATASPGDTVTIVVRNANFAQANSAKVRFDRPNDEFYGEVLSPVVPLTNGLERLTVHLPVSLLNDVPEGFYDVTVFSDYRRGGGKQLQLKVFPTVLKMAPSSGYAAVNSPNSPFVGFVGTEVTLRGFGFDWQDRFEFNHIWEATYKFPINNAVVLHVPERAQTGPLYISHQVRPGDMRTDKTTNDFVVLPPPVILDVQPPEVFPGNSIELTLSNFSLGYRDPLPMLVFPDGGPTPLQWVHGNVFRAQANTTKLGIMSIIVMTPSGQGEHDLVVKEPVYPEATIWTGNDWGRWASPISLQRALDFASGVGGLPVDDDDDPPFEEGDWVSPKAPYLRMGANRSETIVISGETVGDGLMTSDYDTIDSMIMADGYLRGTLTVLGNYNTLTLKIDGSSGDGLVIRGNHNIVNVECAHGAGDGLRIEGGQFNEVTVWAHHNAGNGVVLTDGAAHNNVVVITGDASPNAPGDGWVVGSGNGGHGVLVDNAPFNSVSSPWFFNSLPLFPGMHCNGGDGLRVQGALSTSNNFSFIAANNFGNGCSILAGAHDNTFFTDEWLPCALTNNLGYGLYLSDAGTSGNIIGMQQKVARTGSAYSPRCRSNGRSGIGLFKGVGQSGPVSTTLIAYCSDNFEHGVELSGIADAPGATTVELESESNFRDGLRLANGTKGITCSAWLGGNGKGLELNGADVATNTIFADIEYSWSGGAVITNAHGNLLRLSTFVTGPGPGVILDGAAENQLTVASSYNGGAALYLAHQSRSNLLHVLTLDHSTTGLIIDGGSQNNQLLFEEGMAVAHPVWALYGIWANYGHGAVLQGVNTTSNWLVNPLIHDNAGDGLRVQDGASYNQFQWPGTLFGAFTGGGIYFTNGAGIRIKGAGTRGHVIQGCDIVADSADTNLVGIVVEQGAADVTIGSGLANVKTYIARAGRGVVLRTGATNVVVQNSSICYHTLAGISVETAADVVIGSPIPNFGNDVFNNPGTGLEIFADNVQVLGNSFSGNGEGIALRNGAPRNVLSRNFTGQNRVGIHIEGGTGNFVEQNTISGNTAQGIWLNNGAFRNLIRFNSISRNGTGVEVNGITTQNRISANSITADLGLGILLAQGGNNNIPAPVITDITPETVIGIATNVPDGSQIELFQDSAEEGDTLVATAFVTAGRFRALTQTSLAAVNILFRLNATVTDPDGNTSQFGGYGAPQALADQPAPKLVFASTRDGNSELYLLEAPLDEISPLASATRLTTNAFADVSPTVSADGSTIAFVSDRGGHPEIYVMPAQRGGNASQVTSQTTPDYDPAWSGTNLLFVSERDGDAEIYRVSLKGTGLTRLTTSPGIDRYPAVSPDGTKIAFSSARAGSFKIWVMNSDGTGAHALTDGSGNDTQPVWSPDGSRIAFASDRSGHWEIYMMGADGSQPTVFTHSPGISMDPAWSSDGQTLLCASNRDEGFELYAQKLAGGPPVRLTVSAGDNTHPSVKAK